MASKGGKRSFPLHKVLAAHIKRVGTVYTEAERDGAVRFITELLAGVPSVQDINKVAIKPVSLPGYHDLTLDALENLVSGRQAHYRLGDATNELKRQKKVAKVKRAEDKKAEGKVGGTN